MGGGGNLSISMVLRSERSLKAEMLSLARTSKYVDNTSVLSIRQLRLKRLIKLDSYSVVISMKDKIVPMRNRL